MDIFKKLMTALRGGLAEATSSLTVDVLDSSRDERARNQEALERSGTALGAAIKVEN